MSSRQSSRVSLPGLAALLLLVFASQPRASGGADDSSRLPEVLPTCSAPQLFSPPQSLGNNGIYTYSAPALAWNGADYGSLSYGGSSGLRFQRIYADGSPATAPMAIPLGPQGTGAGYPGSGHLGLVWTGTIYGATWGYYDYGLSRYQIAFATLNPDGVVQGLVRRVSFFGTTPAVDSFNPAIAWSAQQSRFAVAWADDRAGSGNQDIYATVLDATGALPGANTHDLLVSRDGANNPLAGAQLNPRVVITPSAPYLAYFYWEDGRAGVSQIWSRGLALYTDGSAGYFTGENQISNSPGGGAFTPAVAAGPTSMAIAWQDMRNGQPEIYAARLDGAAGFRTSGETRMTAAAGNLAYQPAIAWTGSEFGILFDYIVGGQGDLHFSRLSASGSNLGGPYAITSGWLSYSNVASELAFGKTNFLASSSPQSYAGSFAIPIGCTYDYYPPACPANLHMTSAGWSGASFAWDPVIDQDGSEIAYYELFKDGVTAGRTSGLSLTVTGLSPDARANYEIYAVDADQRRQSACAGTPATSQGNPTACIGLRQAGATASLGGANGSSGPRLVANSTDFGAAYIDGAGLWYQRFHPNGQPRGARVFIGPVGYPGALSAPGLVWTGGAYGLAWYDGAGMRFTRLDAAGVVLQATTSLNAGGATPGVYYAYQNIAIAWNGSLYAVVWEDNRNNATTGVDLYATLLNANGTIAGPTNNYLDIPVATGAGNQRLPAMVWSGSRFVIAFDEEVATPTLIQSVRIDPSTGTADAPVTMVTPPAGSAARPYLVQLGGYQIMAWQDSRLGVSQIFLNYFYNNGATRYMGTDVQISNAPSGAYNAAFVYDNSGSYNFDMVWNEARDGVQRVMRQRITGAWVPTGDSYPLSPPDLGYQLPAIAFSQAGEVVVAGYASGSGNLGFATGLSCIRDDSAPGCPLNLYAGASGATSVGLSWSASTDPETGVDHYVIVRNGVDIATTSKTSYTDTVAAGASYAYAIQPVNWGGARNGACAAGAPVQMPDQPGACPRAQPGAPSSALGGVKVTRGTPIVWNGGSFATLWHDQADGNLYFERLYADGRAIDGSKRTVAAAIGTVDTYGPALVWDGAAYGAAWFSDGAKQFYFQRLDPAGAPLGTPVAVSNSPETTALYGYFTHIALAASGAGYAVAWTDGRNFGTTGADVLVTLLKADGTLDGPAAAWHDLTVDSSPSTQYQPAMVWSPRSARYILAWTDANHASPWILSAALDPATGTLSPKSTVIGAENLYGASEPALAALESGPIGMAWVDSRDWGTGNSIYFTTLNASGVRSGGETRLTTGNLSVYHPSLVWNGAEYGAFWNDSHTGTSQIWYQRVDGGGNGVGAPVQVTNLTETHFPRAAWGAGNYLVTSHPWNSDNGGMNLVTGLGCTADASAPTCPGNLLGYNVSGTQATISWSPAGDPESGLSHYVLYRNNAELALTTATAFTDTGLTLSSAYNYMVQPVNTRGIQNLACTNSLYVKTSASLTLTLNKSTPDAILNWTDAGLNSYTIFRGTSPQVMSLVGATPELSAPDANALADDISYFYTVDDPGQ